jgi:hypothetical protein
MNVKIGTEAAQLLEKGLINGIFVAVLKRLTGQGHETDTVRLLL